LNVEFVFQIECVPLGHFGRVRVELFGESCRRFIDSETLVILVLFDLLDLDCVPVKANTVVLDIQAANFLKCPLITFGAVLPF